MYDSFKELDSQNSLMVPNICFKNYIPKERKGIYMNSFLMTQLMTVLWMKRIAKLNPICYTSYQIYLDGTFYRRGIQCRFETSFKSIVNENFPRP